MKYIIFDNQYPVLFPESITHCTVKIDGKKPTSSGFIVFFKAGDVCCYGESGSLGITSKPEDRLLIEKYLKDIKTEKR